MELNLNTAVVDCYENVFSQTLRQEETQTAVVPEALPDIGSIVCASGTALIRGKDVDAGRIKLEANVPVKVSYRPEEGGGVCGLEVNVPLYASLEDAAIPEDGVCVAELSLSAVEAKLLNPRKVSVRVEAAFTVDCWAESRMEFEGAPEAAAADGVNVRERPVTVTPVRAVTEKTFVVMDEFTVPASQPEAACVLNQQTAARIEDVQSAGGKLVVKGSVKHCVFYADREGETGGVEFSTAFSQIVEIDRMPEGEVFAAVSILLSGAHYDLNDDCRSGNAEVHLVAQAVVRETAEASCLADAYSNRRELELERADREFRRVKTELCLRETLREQLPADPPAASILQGCASLGTPKAEGGKATVPVSVCLLYLDAGGCVQAAKHTYRAEFGYDVKEGESLLPVSASVQELYATPADCGAELRLTLELRAFLVETDRASCVSAVRWDEAGEKDTSNCPTLVILRACAGDDLWSLAKQNCSTVEAILEANGLDAETGSWEKLILIPKTV